jgi:hypothetical protein
MVSPFDDMESPGRLGHFSPGNDPETACWLVFAHALAD